MSSSRTLKVKTLHPDAFIPVRKSLGAAGYDLFAIEAIEIPAQHAFKLRAPLGISIEVPAGTYGRIACRSSLGALGCQILGGVIDSDYRGEVVVMIYFPADVARSQRFISYGQAIAQLILEKIETPEIELVTDLSETERGSGGFGSTNKE